MEKLDFSKSHKDEYTAGRRIKEVDIDSGAAFQKAVGRLYAVAYTLKFAHKTQRDFDFKISKLECLWDIEDPDETPVDEWRRRLLIRTPDSIGETAVEETKAGLRRENEGA